MVKTSKKSNKDRSFSLALALICLGFVLYAYLHLQVFSHVMTGFTLLFLLIALIAPSFFYPFRRVMEILGHYLGIVNTYILLTLIYLFLFIPTGWIRKIFEKDSLRLKWDPNATSYWVEKTDKSDSSMKNQF
jgi:hypothetical protein